MGFMDDYLRRIEEHELPELRKQLAPLDSGSMHLGERSPNGQWTDTTQHWIDHLKRTIGIYEGILRWHRGKQPGE